MRPRSSRIVVALLGAVLVLSGACGQPRGGSGPVVLRGALVEAAPALKKALDDLAPPAQSGQGNQDRRRRAQDPAVYVDGVPVAMLAYLELPPSLPTYWKQLTTGKIVRRFRVAELLSALGVDLESIKQVHLYGGRDRISIVDGAELRRMKGEFLFSFTQSDRGKPRAHYPDEDMTVSSRIDLIDNVAVYVHKEPPRSEGKYQTLTFGNGRPIEGIPYSGGERPGGTRVYVDGALQTFIKRRMLTAASAEPGGAEGEAPRFLLRSYLDTLNVSWSSVKALELLGASDVLACLDAGSLAAMPKLAFALPRQSQGLVAFDLPEVTEPVHAIAIYIRKLPPNRAAGDKPPGASDPPDNNEIHGAPVRRCATVNEAQQGRQKP